MSIRATSDATSNPYLNYVDSLRSLLKSAAAQTAIAPRPTNALIRQTSASTTSPGTAAADARTANFVNHLDAAIHYALSGKSSAPNDNARVVISAIEQEFQAFLHSRGIDSQISHARQHPQHAGGTRRHAAGSTAGAESSAAPDFSAQLGMGGVGRISARDVSRPSRTSHRAPDLRTLVSELNQAPQRFVNDLFLALLRSQHGSSKLAQAIQSIESGVHVNVLA